jgi:hypothetical protein
VPFIDISDILHAMPSKTYPYRPAEPTVSVPISSILVV